ncbi:hypothetical protein LB557_18800 [Mesorhizobium sp. BR115XR7A]|uniref:hypothetical protein n=1 Tax=Mesorhizobium sp. BR115XR7A TaxID=2876645 RepID=UPI001CCBF9AC|nr:hypothetical protein [Mesorhizobium sp. BR115XR7A]MBZ9908063.1 hypothetical protein [Mesorhizobium sp. BR115XR7A]MBZ9931393.1 hypothetical protein [Mesorhizobium sp. BR1-1-5]
MVWHRIAQSDNSVVCRTARLFLSLKMRKFGIQIPVETSIGLGFYIGHGGPCVVHHTATIGNNCNISQYVTIGATLGKSASIGDEVYIGPNVCIVEEVTIGSRSLIGGCRCHQEYSGGEHRGRRPREADRQGAAAQFHHQSMAAGNVNRPIVLAGGAPSSVERMLGMTRFVNQDAVLRNVGLSDGYLSGWSSHGRGECRTKAPHLSEDVKSPETGTMCKA